MITILILVVVAIIFFLLLIAELINEKKLTALSLFLFMVCVTTGYFASSKILYRYDVRHNYKPFKTNKESIITYDSGMPFAKISWGELVSYEQSTFHWFRDYDTIRETTDFYYCYVYSPSFQKVFTREYNFKTNKTVFIDSLTSNGIFKRVQNGFTEEVYMNDTIVYKREYDNHTIYYNNGNPFIFCNLSEGKSSLRAFDYNGKTILTDKVGDDAITIGSIVIERFMEY
jgi:hypothetical protein